jgi:hypothetical protein
MKSKIVYFYLTIAIILLTIITIIIGVLLTQPEQTPTQTPTSSPTQAPTSTTPLSKVTPTTTRTNPPVIYNQEKTNQLLNIVKTRPQLSDNDKRVRGEIIAPLRNQSGNLTTTTMYKIEYVKTADAFLIEITSINISQAKNNAVQWFREKGISPEGICNLPVSFYLSRNAANSLKEMGGIFNPLPENC